MALKEKIEEELKKALKDNDSFKRDTLRFLMAVIKNKEIEKRGQGALLEDKDVMEVLRKEVKKREEAASIYKSSGRMDLYEKEEKERSIIESLLPPQMSDEEIASLVDNVLTNFSQPSLKDMGKIIEEVAKIAGERASRSKIAQIVKTKLEK